MMLRFTLIQECGQRDEGDLLIDADDVLSVITAEASNEHGTFKTAVLYLWGGLRWIVHDPDRDAQQRIADARGEMIADD